MMRLGKFGAAALVGLALSLALFTTGAFAQGVSQSIEHGNISVSAHAAVVKSIMQGTARVILGSAVQRPNDAKDNCGNGGWGNNCRGGDGNGRWNNDFRPRPTTFRCTSQRECRTIQVCHSSRLGRVCQGVKNCRFRSVCRRCIDNDWNRGGGFGGGSMNTWSVKKH